MKSIQCLCACLGLAILLMATGCDSNTQTANKSGPSSSTVDSGEHVHADGTVHKNHGEEGHSHGGHAHGPGPHDGTVADWGGGKFHVEFTVDHDKQEATVYILGTDEKTPTSIDAAEITLTIKEPSLTTTLKASPQGGDPEGKASCFVGTHEGLAVVREYEGSMSGVVDGTPYSGSFKEEPHEH